MPRIIEQQIRATYFALRMGAAVIGFVFPLLLWGGGKVAGFTLRDSMSAYYWATPSQLCPCGENPDRSCRTKGSEVDIALTPPPREKALEPGTMRVGSLAYYSRLEYFCTSTRGIAGKKIGL